MSSKIVLVGFIGVGKTEVGQALASCLQLPFFDIDKNLEKKMSLTITEIITQYGLERFRDMESDALGELVESDMRCVVATGGGSLIRPANRTAIRRNACVVWLQAEPETIWRRIQHKPYVAPLFFTKHDPLIAIRIEIGRRERYYREVADATISVDGKDPAIVVKEIQGALQDER